MKLSTAFRFLRPRTFREGRLGRCPVCGKATFFVMTGSLDTVRNHALCVRCGSCSRNRHVALAILDALADRGVRALADLRGRPEIAVLHTATTGALANALRGVHGAVFSEFLDGVPPGTVKDGILCQDLQALAFPDARFDLVISEEVLEHVPDYRAAFREVHRVLKPGGAHVFTIPFHFDRKTRDLFTRVEGRPVLHEPVEYHGDPVRGLIPTFTHFGHDLFDLLEEKEYEVTLRRTNHRDDRLYGTFDSFTFTTRRPR